MNTRAWRLTGVTLLCLGLAGPLLADQANPLRGSSGNQQQQQQMQQQQMQQRQQQQVQQQRNQDQRQQQQHYQEQRAQQQRQQDVYQQQRQMQQRQQQQFQDQQQRQQQLRDNQMQRQMQQRQQQQQQQQRRQQEQQLQQRQSALPIQSRPNEVVQSQPARPGRYEDIPRRGGNELRGAGPRPDWGHSDGWGDGPRYRPGHEIERMPGGYSRIPWRGQDYYYSSGYWYRPQGQRYVVVTPPYGARVGHLPSYAREVWYGGTLFFLAAGTYYLYENSTQDFVVATPPANVEPIYTPPPEQASSGYDVIPYPAQGQSQAQLESDRYECYRWAAQQTGFDPATATYQPAPEVIDAYRQNMAACLQGRGYAIN